MLSTLPPSTERIDLLLWDYSNNDRYLIKGSFRTHGSFFFPHLFHLHPHITAVGVVHWLETWNCTLGKRGTISPNSMATLNYPYFKHMFNPRTDSVSGIQSRISPFANVSLFALSLPQFCNAGFCNPFDYLRRDTSHQSDAGVAVMADLVVWHLLPYFDLLLERQCHPHSARNRSRDESVDTDDKDVTSNENSESEIHEHLINNTQMAQPNLRSRVLTSDVKLHPSRSSLHWLTDAKLVKVMVNETAEIDQEYIDARGRIKDVLSAMYFMSPVMRSPLPMDQLAFRCVKSDGSTVWLPVDILMINKEKCEGFLKCSPSFEWRSDAEFTYFPNMVKPEVKNRTWEEHGKVRNSDLLFRINTTLDWRYVCFLPCAPTGTQLSHIDSYRIVNLHCLAALDLD